MKLICFRKKICELHNLPKKELFLKILKKFSNIEKIMLIRKNKVSDFNF